MANVIAELIYGEESPSLPIISPESTSTSFNHFLVKENKEFQHGVRGGDMGPRCPASPPSRRVSDHGRGPRQTRQCGEAVSEPSSSTNSCVGQRRSTIHSPSEPRQTTGTRCPRLLHQRGEECQQGCPTIPQLREQCSSTRSIQAPELQHFPPSCSVLRPSTFCECSATQFDGRSYAPNCRWL